MTAIIIVAMVLVLIALGSYGMQKVNLLQKRERNLYDIFSLMEFLREMNSIQPWGDFLRKTQKIVVVRRPVTGQDEKQFPGLSKEGYVCYDFCLENKTYSIYQEIAAVHQKRRKKLFQDSFYCEIAPSKVKMYFYGSFDQKIFITSCEAAIQNLQLIAETQAKEMKEAYAKYAEWSKEIKETMQWLNLFF